MPQLSFWKAILRADKWVGRMQDKEGKGLKGKKCRGREERGWLGGK